VSHIDDKLWSDIIAAAGADVAWHGDAVDRFDPGFHDRNLAARCVVAPRTAKAMAAVMRLCNDSRVSIVPHGGRTGLAGGAVSKPGQVVLSTENLASMVSIHARARIAQVDAGVRLSALQAAASKQGLSPGIDLAARDSATIGGMISTNAGGNEAFRNGVMRHRVLGLEVAMPNGEILRDLKHVTKANEGYDIKQLFIGAEGTLGIVTRAVLKLEPLASGHATALVACPDGQSAVSLFSRLQNSADVTLAAAEMMWRNYAQTSAEACGLRSLRAFMEAPAELFVIVECHGPGEGGEEALEGELASAAEAGEIHDAVVARSERERSEIWRVREDSWSIDRTYPHGLWFDVSVPLDRIGDYVRDLRARVAAVDGDLMVFAMGHLGDGNLHLTITSGQPEARQQYDRVAAAVYHGLADIGGSFSAEHGIGTEKRAAFKTHVAPEMRAFMSAIKQTFDPHGIMNPGKLLSE
jgi:FAD/FMN-containing dehydrogenase